jgi:hypothetical protein
VTPVSAPVETVWPLTCLAKTAANARITTRAGFIRADRKYGRMKIGLSRAAFVGPWLALAPRVWTFAGEARLGLRRLDAALASRGAPNRAAPGLE